MRCALIRIADNIVVNLIVADPVNDPAPFGCVIVGLADGSQVSIGWLYNPVTNEFTNPESQNG